MCTIGEIIVIEHYTSVDHHRINKHSFVVISDEKGIIQGLEFDFIASVMSSFKGQSHKEKKLRFKENFHLKNKDKQMYASSNEKEGYLKLDQLHFFKKETIKFYCIGKINDDILQNIKEILDELNQEKLLVANINNL